LKRANFIKKVTLGFLETVVMKVGASGICPFVDMNGKACVLWPDVLMK
jgi:hypothetical protein